MRFRLLMLAPLCLTSSALAGADNGGAVTVAFDAPDRFTDAGVTQRERERNLELIERFLIDHVTPCMDPEDRVEIRVSDVSLAGRYEWWRSPQGVRIMGPADWPQLKLEYRWEGADGNTLAEQQESVADRNYLRRAGVHRDRPLVFENRMIRHWARATFCDPDD